jgi:hypothetical protein
VLSVRGRDASEEDEEGADTWAAPLLQCGPQGVRHEEAVLERLLRLNGFDMTLATAYLNPTERFFDMLEGFSGAWGSHGAVTYDARAQAVS